VVAAPPGYSVNLTSSDPAVLQVPATVFVPPEVSFATFPIMTTVVTAATTVTVTGEWVGIGSQYSAVVTVQPDVVVITSAMWRKGTLHVRATDVTPTARLTLYIGSVLVGELPQTGNGDFYGEFARANAPGSVRVRSSFGGTAATVVVRL